MYKNRSESLYVEEHTYFVFVYCRVSLLTQPVDKDVTQVMLFLVNIKVCLPERGHCHGKTILKCGVL